MISARHIMIQGEKTVARITARELSALKPKSKAYVVYVEPGLYLRVATNGVKRWVVRFTVDGKQRDARLPQAYSLRGAEGVLTLAEARQKKEEILAYAREGIDFRDKLEEEKQARLELLEKQAIEKLTVSDLFEAWIKNGVAREDGNAELKRLFNKDILPEIGSKLLKDLSDDDILEILRKMLSRGVTRLAIVAYNDLDQMLSWGEKRQPWRGLLIDGNPCDLVIIANLLPADYEEERDRILFPEEIRELHDIFKQMEQDWLNAPNRRIVSHPVAKKTQIALWLCLSTLCRIGELLIAKWEHIDFKDGTWLIPRENVKGGRGKKQEHYVFLSKFAQKQFKELKSLTGKSEWCFPSRNSKEGEEIHVCVKSVSKQVGDRQIQFKNREKPLKARVFDNSLVLADGANGGWTPHDLRRTGATMMQQLGVSLDVIDRCQNHILAGSKVRRHYLHYDYRDEKTEAWKKLGKRIEEILGCASD